MAIVSQHARDSPPIISVSAEEGFLLVEWGPMDVVACYIPPRLNSEKYENALEEHMHRRSSRPIMVGEDFNAHVTEWGSPTTDFKNECTLQWAAALGLVLLNRNRMSTFVDGRRESIIDITWTSPQAAKRMEGMESRYRFLE